ncbi:hypothetical protein DMH12_03925 [Streptomyces sp. WAC 04229]|uniref:hypothetical protein n=1 Tax=Streptomyces sp. WAC 04229 TaxID=2203206 RepID=UPI000F745CF8|nr:hypothetical protein [Streptomyces sp. WAC 04229]RSN64176.1 hypothetical protein DMH12_03925 [Streptomyces sp. WAC 04229]
MTHPDSGFRVAFSDFLRESGRWRDVEPEVLLARWVRFVESCEHGYRSDAQDYFNDLTSRDSLERAMGAVELQKFPELSQLRAKVEAVDVRFRSMLLPDAFPRIDEKFWWARGVVRYGRKRLVEDMRREYRLEIAEIE